MTARVLRQLPFSRWAGAIIGVTVIATGVYVGTLLIGGPVNGIFIYIAVLAAAIVALGVVCVARIPFLRAELGEDSVLVRGYVTATRIPRAAITGVTGWPKIEWTDPTGKSRRTQVSFLHTPGALPFVQRHSEDGRRILTEWARGGKDAAHP